jgi:glycosyltransferase involved in cell wall biosynthesis
MSNQKKLSVILLAHNVKDYVAQALDSILMQHVDFDFEILVGDDGSSDGTIEILRKYKLKHPELIKLYLTPRVERSHGGDYINFSNLYKKAESEYITILDGDDYWISEKKLQKQIDFLDLNLDFTVCGHNYFFENMDGILTPAHPGLGADSGYSFICEDFQQMLLGGHCPYMQTSSVVYRNVFLNNQKVHNYFNHYMFKGDFIRTLLHSAHGKSKFINELMSVYRITGQGDWTKTSEIQKCLSHIKFFIFHKYNTFDNKYKRSFNQAIYLEVKRLLKLILAS